MNDDFEKEVEEVRREMDEGAGLKPWTGPPSLPQRPTVGHSVQRDMLDFFRHVGGTVGETPALRNHWLNARLILEEARETAESITGCKVTIEVDPDQAPDRPRSLEGTIDGLCDMLATVYGAAVTFGIDLAPFWPEIHRANMDKVGGPQRGDGKRLKPDDWTPPNLALIFAEIHPGVCRVCGCTPALACWHENHGPCSWAEVGLCTACTSDAGDGWMHPTDTDFPPAPVAQSAEHRPCKPEGAGSTPAGGSSPTREKEQ